DALHDGKEELDSPRGDLLVEEDDIDHFGNRRLRTVGELIQNQLRTGLARMERVVRERMTTQDVEAITPQSLINIRPVVAALKEFFGTSQLSQFMDQTNPIAGLTHKRRLSALGPGGISRDRAQMDVRVLVRTRGGEPVDIPRNEVEYMDVSPRQMVSVATALIPFLEHDDANRALMGANMKRQAVPLIKSDAPLVGTGMEYRAAVDAGDVLTADQPGVVREVSADAIEVMNDDGT